MYQERTLLVPPVRFINGESGHVKAVRRHGRSRSQRRRSLILPSGGARLFRFGNATPTTLQCLQKLGNFWL